MPEKSSKNSNDHHESNKVIDTTGTETKSQGKSKFILIPRPGSLKDKKTLEKDNRNYQKRINVFLEEIVGVSTLQQKHMPVIASDIPFRFLRNLGTIIGECHRQDINVSVLSEELQNYFENNLDYKRGPRALLEKLRFDENENSVIYVYLYSMIDDRFDMISYIPTVLSKILDNSTPQSLRQSSPSRSSSSATNLTTNKGKSIKR